MKKLLLIIIVSASLFACATQSAKSEKQPIGFDMSGGEGRTDLYGGNLANVEIIEKFLKAHNDRDTATIRSLEATENLKIYTPEGNVVTYLYLGKNQPQMNLCFVCCTVLSATN